MGDKLKELRDESRAEGKPSAIKQGGVTTYKGQAKKKKANESTEKVDAAAIDAAKKAAEEQLKKNQAEAKKKKLSPLDIAMGRR